MLYFVNSQMSALLSLGFQPPADLFRIPSRPFWKVLKQQMESPQYLFEDTKIPFQTLSTPFLKVLKWQVRPPQ